nr:xylulose kinase-1 [Tanacetum cinerariifolium]
MTLTFAETHNMIAYLTKSDASEGFNQIINFLNESSIKYALTVNPNIYISCIKQFWTSVAVKKVNDVTQLQALVDKKKVIITEASIRDALRLDDAKGRNFNFSKYIFDNLVRNMDSSTKFYMYPCFLQFMIIKQVGDLSTHTTKYTSLALTQKVFANMRWVRKVFSGVETPLFEGMIVEQQVDEGDAEVNVDDVSTAGVAVEGRMIADIDADVDVVLKDDKEVIVEKSTDVDESADVQGRKAKSQAQIYHIDLEHANKVLNMQDDEGEPAELQEVVEAAKKQKLDEEVEELKRHLQ